MTFRQRFKYFLIRKIAKYLIYGVMKLCRFKIEGEENLEGLKEKGKPVIFVFWHRDIFVMIYRFRRTGARPLISQSGDGEIVAQVAEECGMNPVRGSSSRGGARAFLELVNTVKQSASDILITADGPKGPACEVKEGSVRLARKTGSVIVPVAWKGSRVKILEKTWDGFKIPIPFSSVTFKYGSPLVIPQTLSSEDEAGFNHLLTEAILEAGK